jgi:LVIVD repeat-containing protein
MGGMNIRSAVLSGLVLALAACGGDNNTGQSLVANQIAVNAGDRQTTRPGSPLAQPLSVLVTDVNGAAVPDVAVGWSVVDGGGSVEPAASNTNSNGVASAQFTLGPGEGDQHAQATATGLVGSPVAFTAHATESPGVTLRVLSGGNNVQERYTSDLWVHGSYAYTGTWGAVPRSNDVGDVLKVWSLSASGAPSLVNSITIPDISTVSDVQVSDDGQLLMFTTEYDPGGGLYLYSIADPAHPVFLDRALASDGLHTATLAEINGGRYAFAARNQFGAGPALLIYDVSDPSDISLIVTVPVPANYGLHDTFVRDGLLFAFAWNTGVIIYDVGNGMRGGSPSSPVAISRLVTAATGAGSPAVHNGWWFHNPVTGEKRYLFIGQEGPGVTGSQSSGDIHVVDVFDLAHPREVAFFHLAGAGTHNFWMDESRQILYAAYYNAGVIALDVSGTLSGDLSGRLLSQIKPGGAGNTFTWGVQLANGSLYASDMLSGLWQVGTE